jgi:hypothetical protein
MSLSSPSKMNLPSVSSYRVLRISDFVAVGTKPPL